MENETKEKEVNHALENAKSWADDIQEVMENLNQAREENSRLWEEKLEEQIMEMPLDIEYRSSWTHWGNELEPTEYSILLTTGGPALRIVGQLNQYKEPETARLEYQDWFTPWVEYHTDEFDLEACLLDFASFFCFDC